MQAQKEKSLGVLWVFTAISVLYLVPWAIAFIFSPMLFDAPGSENDPYLWGVMAVFYLYPVLVLVCPIIARLKISEKPISAAIWAVFPFVYATAIIMIIRLEIYLTGVEV